MWMLKNPGEAKVEMGEISENRMWFVNVCHPISCHPSHHGGHLEPHFKVTSFTLFSLHFFGGVWKMIHPPVIQMAPFPHHVVKVNYRQSCGGNRCVSAWMQAKKKWVRW